MIKERKETLQRFFQEKLLNAEADWKQLKSVLSDAAKQRKSCIILGIKYAEIKK